MCVHDKSEPCIGMIGYDENAHETVITIMFGVDDDLVEERLEILGKEPSATTINTQIRLLGYENLRIVDAEEFNIDYLMAHNECACAAI